MNMKFTKPITIFIAVIIIVSLITVILVLNNSQVDNGLVRGLNYNELVDGTKVNISEEVTKNKQVQDILIEQSKIRFSGGTSKLTSKVTNNGETKDNLMFTVRFIANDNSTIAESIGYIGQIKSGEVKYIDSGITMDISNAKDLVYEIKN